MFQFRRFPSHAYFVQRGMTAYCAAGLPHSEIPGSMDICSSPRLFAACHVLRRLLMPRHSPCALSSLTCSSQAPYRSPPSASLSACDDVSLIPLLLAFHQKTAFFDDGDGGHETLWPLLRVVRESWFSLRIMQALQRLTKLLLPCTLPGAVPQSICSLHVPAKGPLCCLTCFLSHCSVFKVQVSDLF